MIRRTAIAVVVVLLAASCTQLRGGGPGDEGLVVTVGVTGLGGDRVVTVTAPSPPPSGSVNVLVWLDAMEGPPIAQGPSPLTFTLDGDTAPAGIHRVVAASRSEDGIRYGFGYFNTELRLNQVQVLGTHNSYHVAPNPSPVPEWEYSHDPLDVQLESQGIRQFELDVWADPNGHKVFHVPVIDANTNCSVFKTCLQVIKHWSNDHRNHMPIAIQIEIEDTPYTPDIKPFDAAAFDQLDAEIRAVFPPYRVFTPDDERGAFPTLADAVTKGGWPTIKSLRGQVMFLMDNAGSYRDIYTAGRPNLEGRMLFTNSSIGRPDAAFIKLNDPVGDAQRIHDAVAAGYVVRTRADADTHEARDNNTVPRDAAINGGAQWVSTDFEVPGKAYGGPYYVSIPGGTPARCNPLNTPSWCTSSMIEPGG
jgi:hypothetical protein